MAGLQEGFTCPYAALTTTASTLGAMRVRQDGTTLLRGSHPTRSRSLATTPFILALSIPPEGTFQGIVPPAMVTSLASPEIDRIQAIENSSRKAPAISATAKERRISHAHLVLSRQPAGAHCMTTLMATITTRTITPRTGHPAAMLAALSETMAHVLIKTVPFGMRKIHTPIGIIR